MIAIVGGGPAGLRAAEMVAQHGAEVALFEAQASVGRKFLVAGKGGLNLTHDEALEPFAARYSGLHQPSDLWPSLLAECGPDQLRTWAADLGVETFSASSGRVYPRDLKAASLLRSWVHRLRERGVEFHVRHRLVGLSNRGVSGYRLEFACGTERATYDATAVVLALGGGSWPQTGSDGSWVSILERQGICVRPLEPANCGWAVEWPRSVLARGEGEPLKNIAASAAGEVAEGELLVTLYGLEGGAIYQLGRALRGAPSPSLEIDFKPDSTVEQLVRRLGGTRSNSWVVATERWRLSPVTRAILEAYGEVAACLTPTELAQRVKRCRVPLKGPRPLAEAISTAGGVAWPELDETLMLRRMPGVFVAGEMIDWEAPTGGYLLQGAFATGHRAGFGAAHWATC